MYIGPKQQGDVLHALLEAASSPLKRIDLAFVMEHNHAHVSDATH